MANSSHPSTDHDNSSAFNPAWLIGALIVLIPVGASIYYLFDWNQETPEVIPTLPLPVIQQVEIPPPIIEIANVDNEIKELAATTVTEVIIDPLEPIITEPEQEVAIPPAPPKLTLKDTQGIVVALSQLSENKNLLSWLKSDEIIRKTVVLIDNAAQGNIFKKYLFIPKPSAKFSISKKYGREYIHPESYTRYNSYLDSIESINIDMVASVYNRLKPLLNKAFAELGYSNRSFHNTFINMLDVILKAPVITEELELTRSSVMYKYTDPSLEALPNIYKQLLRIGPTNTQRLQQKVMQIKAAIN